MYAASIYGVYPARFLTKSDAPAFCTRKSYTSALLWYTARWSAVLPLGGRGGSGYV